MDYLQARKNMVDGQLTPNKITDKDLLDRFLAVPREAFVDVAYKNISYIDNPVNINSTRQMFPPLVTAHMLQALDIHAEDNVLVVASASGYTASIVSTMANSVYGVEDDLSLLEMSRRALLDSKCKKVTVCEGIPSNGLEEKGKFTKIVIDTPVDFIPETIFDQLSDGGMLSAVVKSTKNINTVKLFTKNGRKVEELAVREVVNMETHPAFQLKKEFTL